MPRLNGRRAALVTRPRPAPRPQGLYLDDRCSIDTCHSQTIFGFETILGDVSHVPALWSMGDVDSGWRDGCAPRLWTVGGRKNGRVAAGGRVDRRAPIDIVIRDRESWTSSRQTPAPGGRCVRQCVGCSDPEVSRRQEDPRARRLGLQRRGRRRGGNISRNSHVVLALASHAVAALACVQLIAMHERDARVPPFFGYALALAGCAA